MKERAERTRNVVLCKVHIPNGQLLYDEFIIEIYETGCNFLVSPNKSALLFLSSTVENASRRRVIKLRTLHCAEIVI